MRAVDGKQEINLEWPNTLGQPRWARAPVIDSPSFYLPLVERMD